METNPSVEIESPEANKVLELIGCGLIILWVKLLYGKVELYKPLAEFHAGSPFHKAAESSYVYEDQN